MKLLANHLFQNGVAAKSIMYVSMDDYLLRDNNAYTAWTYFRRSDTGSRLKPDYELTNDDVGLG